MELNIEIVDFSFLKRINKYLIVSLIISVFLLSTIGTFYYFFKTVFLENFILILLFFVIIILLIYLFLILFPKKMDKLLIYENTFFYKGQYYGLEYLCIDINTAHLPGLTNNNKKEILKFININEIPKFGNFLINKKTKEKYEFIINNRSQLKLLLNILEPCFSERPIGYESLHISLLDWSSVLYLLLD